MSGAGHRRRTAFRAEQGLRRPCRFAVVLSGFHSSAEFLSGSIAIVRINGWVASNVAHADRTITWTAVVSRPGQASVPVLGPTIPEPWLLPAWDHLGMSYELLWPPSHPRRMTMLRTLVEKLIGKRSSPRTKPVARRRQQPHRAHLELEMLENRELMSASAISNLGNVPVQFNLLTNGHLQEIIQHHIFIDLGPVQNLYQGQDSTGHQVAYDWSGGNLNEFTGSVFQSIGPADYVAQDGAAGCISRTRARWRWRQGCLPVVPRARPPF